MCFLEKMRFNPNGNPVFSQFVVGAMGSPNMKLLVVRNESGEPVAVAMSKIKRLEDGTPVLFLERGLYRGSYDYREQMLELLRQKAKKLNPKPRVMDETFGKGFDGNIILVTVDVLQTNCKRRLERQNLL